MLVKFVVTCKCIHAFYGLQHYSCMYVTLTQVKECTRFPGSISNLHTHKKNNVSFCFTKHRQNFIHPLNQKFGYKVYYYFNNNYQYRK